MEQIEYTAGDLERIGREWCDRLKKAYEREEDWFKAAEQAEAAYLCDEKAQGTTVPDFNILHSNVETIVPAIYNSTPKPDIRPRDKSDNGVSKELADTHERVIAALIDDNVLDVEVEEASQDAFMAGRGIVRLKFDAEIEQVPVLDMMGQPAVDEMGEPITQAQVSDERVVYECVSWRDFRMGPSKRWETVPWVAYCHYVNEQELERLENPDFPRKEVEGDKKDAPKEEKVWEIWDREGLEVLLLVEETSRVLDIKPDPLGLEDFFPQGKPIQPIKATGKTVPVCPYKVYSTLAEELDTATRRINAIMKGLRVRGVIAGDATVIDAIQEAGDNQLAVAPNIEGLIAMGGLEKAVMWWPVEQAVAVLAQLYQQREDIKQQIYEITGISDIVRGQGQASETATAQNIKQQWGSLRIKKMQNMIERSVREIFMLTAEMVAKHFSLQTIQKLAGMPIDPSLEGPLRAWDSMRIDVETDSTIRADATKNRREMGEFLNGTAQFFETMAGIAAQAPATISPMASMYAAFAQQFNLGKEAEDALEQLVQMAKQSAQQEQGPSPEEIAAKRAADVEDRRLALDEDKHALEERRFKFDQAVASEGARLDRDTLDLKEAEAEVNAAEKLDKGARDDAGSRLL